MEKNEISQNDISYNGSNDSNEKEKLHNQNAPIYNKNEDNSNPSENEYSAEENEKEFGEYEENALLPNLKEQHKNGAKKINFNSLL